MGKGLEIEWQDGPLGQGTDAREPNGTFVEDGLAAMRDRIDWYQTTAFACSENAAAIADLDSALGWFGNPPG